MCDENDGAIIDAMIVMAHGLKQRVIAEGVESVEQWDRLKAIGCDQAQGFYMSEALSNKDLVEFLRSL